MLNYDDVNPLLIDIPMPIETDRLILREPRAGDGAAVTAAKMETWSDLTHWMNWAKDSPPSPEKDEIFMRQASADFIRRTDLMLVGIERTSLLPVVFTGLHRIDWHRREFEIGYWARKSAQGKGYVTEAVNALTRFAFDVLSARKVVIIHAEGNHASGAVAQRLGFSLETLEHYGISLPNGDVVDQYKYARFNTEGLPPINVKWP